MVDVDADMWKGFDWNLGLEEGKELERWLRSRTLDEICSDRDRDPPAMRASDSPDPRFQKTLPSACLEAAYSLRRGSDSSIILLDHLAKC